MPVKGLHTTRFEKLLVANRGEISIRIQRGARELGIKTVAVYSDADRSAPHVRYADEAYYIGKSPARESYLVIDKIIDAARRAGAEAVHPGYGFLAERAEFAQACYDAGLIFIGPPPDAIDTMGDKQMARAAVRQAGVPIVPGTEPGLSDDELAQAAERMGYPVLVKAAAGGGGKGMRPVYAAENLRDALAGARREAEAAFGDGTVYLEKMIVGARHIEFQILADAHGNAVYLGERECSLQRRHQKLIEECPSVYMTEELRQQMGAVAVAAAQAVNYVSAGTIEFLVDKDRNFYFLEMNTRLQVEHPITELVAGVDIVQEQLRIARGRPLRLGQEDVKLDGWAIECRINAEDPYNNYLPSTGQIRAITLPSGPGIRVDTGVDVGSEITPYYDSMISKLICYGKTRAEAIVRMLRALDEYRIMGLRTNIPFHIHMINSHGFQSGKFDTKFVEERFSMDDKVADYPLEAGIIAALIAHQTGQQASQMLSRTATGDGDAWKWRGRIEQWRR